LRREDRQINAKRVYRLYCEVNLGLRTRTPKRRVSCWMRVGRPEPEQINACWAMHFVADELFAERGIDGLLAVGP
jgi:putative transposase